MLIIGDILYSKYLSGKKSTRVPRYILSKVNIFPLLFIKRD